MAHNIWEPHTTHGQGHQAKGWSASTRSASEQIVDLGGDFGTFVEPKPHQDDSAELDQGGVEGSVRSDDAGALVVTEHSRRPQAGISEPLRPLHRATDLRAPEQVGKRTPAQEGLRGALNMLGMRWKPGSAEATARAARRSMCMNFSRAMTVTVANPDGGSGKTPTVAMLAGAFGVERGGGVGAWDNNELRGALALRTAAGGREVTVRDLLDTQSADTGRREDIDRYLRHQPAGHYKVLASAAGGDVLVTAEEFSRVHALVSRYYELLVIDTGNNEGAENWRAALDMTDQLVVPVKWKMTSCTIAAQMLEDLERSGKSDLVAGAVIVAMNGPGDASGEHRGRYLDYFAERARAVVEIPTDPHIHADGVIEHDALHPKTVRAINELAAQVATGLVEADQRPTKHDLQTPHQERESHA